MAGVLAIGWASSSLWRPSSEVPANTPNSPWEPAQLEVLGDTLTMRDANQQVLWHQQFKVPLREFYSPATGVDGAALMRATAIVDLDGDGHKEVLLARTDPADPTVYCFNRDGHERFTYVNERPVRFGTDRCPPVRFDAIYVDTASGRAPAVWITGHHAENFPSVLQRIDASGRARSEYWSNGFIGAFRVLQLGGRRLTFVGANNNETGGASVAVFEGEVTGSAPAVQPKYQCTGCLAGGPSTFLVFPRSRFQQELSAGATVRQFIRSANDRVTVEVIAGGLPGTDTPIAIAYYTLDRDLRLVHAEMGSGFVPLQRKYQAEHRVTAATRFTGETDLYPVRRWNGHGYDLISGPELK